MSDYFKDNTELFLTGSIKEIATKIEQEWWVDKSKQLTRLSGSLDTELIEYLPEDLRKQLLGREISPEEFDEELPDDSFLLKTFKKSKGKGYLVCCNNKLFNDTKKLQRNEKEEIIETLHHLSASPSGSLLPKPHKLKRIGSGGLGGVLEKEFGTKVNNGYQGNQDGKTIFYQYRCGASQKKRLVWVVDQQSKVVRIVFYGVRGKLEKLYA